MVLETIAVIAAGLFAGAAAYINIVQHPAAVRLGTSQAVAFFAPMYARAAPLQASLAMIGSLAGLGSWWAGSGLGWLVGALCLASAIPFTLVVMKPVNDRLKNPSLDARSDEAKQLLVKWWRLHAVRSVAGLLSFLVFVLSLPGS
ncbi:hypothetical protein GCM10028792_16730 [Salinisphaera aquimarina]